MDERTLYLQQLVQVSDFLVMQRNMARALASMAMAMVGPIADGTKPSFASTIPPGVLPTWGTNLRVAVPALQLYQLNAVDPNQWPLGSGPGAPVPILTSDAIQLMMQGLSLGSVIVGLTATPDVALSIGGGNSIYYLIQAQLNPSVDQNNFVLPYQSLIRTTVTSATDTTHLVVGSTVGMSQGDRISIPGFTFGANTTTTIASVTDSTHIVLTDALTSTTNIGNATLLDLNPAAGAPLNGPGNTGVAQPIDRVWGITFSVKAGTAAPTPSRPSADAGFVPLWLVGPLGNGFTGSTGSTSIVVAVDDTSTQTAPFLPGLVGASHHRGLPGHANKIILTGGAESDYTPVNKAGDFMSGNLSVPTLDIASRGALITIGGVNNVQFRSNYDPVGATERNPSLSSWVEALGQGGDEWSIFRARGMVGAPVYLELLRLLCTSGPTSDPAHTQIALDLAGFRITRFTTGSYVGNTALGPARTIPTSFTPVAVIVIANLVTSGAPAGAESIYFLYGTALGASLTVTSGVLQAQIFSSGGVGGLVTGGFITPALSNLLNQTSFTYNWLAWG